MNAYRRLRAGSIALVLSVTLIAACFLYHTEERRRLPSAFCSVCIPGTWYCLFPKLRRNPFSRARRARIHPCHPFIHVVTCSFGCCRWHSCTHIYTHHAACVVAVLFSRASLSPPSVFYARSVLCSEVGDTAYAESIRVLVRTSNQQQFCFTSYFFFVVSYYDTMPVCAWVCF